MEAEKTGDLLQKRRQKLEDLRQKNIDLYPNNFKVAHTIKDIRQVVEDPDATVSETDPMFTTAGRTVRPTEMKGDSMESAKASAPPAAG